MPDYTPLVSAMPSSPLMQKARQAYALSMLKNGMDTTPISSPWQGVARMAQSLFGGMALRSLANADKQSGVDLANTLLGNGAAAVPGASAGPSIPPQALSPSPLSGAPTGSPNIPSAALNPAPSASTGDLSGGFMPPQGGSPYAAAIAKNESGGNYSEVGPATHSGDRAYGKYQVMGANIPQWTKEVLGQSMTPQQFLASPQAQDAVFNAKFGQYTQKYGPEGAAKAWFAGEGGMNDPGRKDMLGTTVADYAQKFLSNLGPTQAQAAEAPQINPRLMAMLSPNAMGGQSGFTMPASAPQVAPQPAPNAPPSGMMPFTSPQNVQNITPIQAQQPNITNVQTRSAQLPIGNPGITAQPSASSLTPQQQTLIRRLLVNPATRAYGMQLYSKLAAPTHYGFMQTPGGDIVSTNPDTGSVKPVYHGSGTNKWGVIKQDQYGQPIYGWINPSARTVTPVEPPGNVGGSSSPANLPTGPAFIKYMESTGNPHDAQDVKTAQAMVEGRMAPFSGFVMKTPYGRQMMQYAAQIEPGFDMTLWKARNDTRSDFSKGKAAQAITSFNTAIGHLGSLYDSIKELDNSSVPSWNWAKNTVLPAIGDTSKAAALKDFSAKRQAVVDELTRAFRGTGGNVHDIKGWEDTINNADSPQALHAAVNAAVDLLKSRVAALNDQYQRGMRTSSAPPDFLTSKSHQVLAHIAGITSEGKTPKPGSYRFNPETGKLEPVQ